MNSEGKSMYDLAKRLFPICRSITGDGNRETLTIIKESIPGLKCYEVPSGTEVFDWTVPNEWNISDAYIETLSGTKIIEFKNNNLHVMGYSIPVDEIVSLQELMKHVYTQSDNPQAVPYVTSYYKERYGFCMTEHQKQSLCEANYHIVIDSSLKPGSLTYGEILIPGETEEEIFISTYICHPSMANNELSGPCVVTELVKWLEELAHRKYTYRIIFIPETIGSITYLSRNLETMKKNVVAGFNVSCVGDDNTYSYISSPYGDTLADKVAINVLRDHFPEYQEYSFLERGSDERQYSSPLVKLPVCSICRSKYGEYPEYHTSLDNLDFISMEGLQGAFDAYRKCIIALENNIHYRITCHCEPQMGKRGLYPTISQKGNYDEVKIMMDFLAYADGRNDLIDISNIIEVPVESIIPCVKTLLASGLIEIVN